MNEFGISRQDTNSMHLPKLKRGGEILKNAVLLFAMLFAASAAVAQTSVLTYHYDNRRTGQNTEEKILSPMNVRPDQFRRLFIQSVDGDIYAQPLYLPNLTIPGKGTHNVVFVATEGDSVYAFDADNMDGPNAQPLWVAHMACTATDPSCTNYGAPASARTILSDAPPLNIDSCLNLAPQIGITGTPVIDNSTGTLYVVTKTNENNSAVQRLHAVDVATGAEKLGKHTVISASVPKSSGGYLQFEPLWQNQRPGLLLQNGFVYIAWGSHCDAGTWHGWIMAYDAQTLAQKAVFATTPNGNEGGIWMEGAGLAADANGNLFVAVGNGDFDTNLDSQGFPKSQNYGDSIVKFAPGLQPVNGEPVVDYFTPFDQAQLGVPPIDQDLGSGGVLLLPDQPASHPHLLVIGGKGEASLGSTIYVIDRDQMTAGNKHFCSGCGSDLPIIVNELANGFTNPNGARNTSVPVYWNHKVYLRGDADVLKAYTLDNLLKGTAPVQSASDDTYNGKVIVSANGDTNGVVWSLKIDGAGLHMGIPAALNAYDAVDLWQLYSSDWNLSRDSPGGAVNFTSPVVANGKVYVGASQTGGCGAAPGCGQLSVFSLFGIGGYDLGASQDQAVGLDYDGSGKPDHLVLYRPGAGIFWILKNSAGAFIPVYQGNGIGIGGYDLRSSADRAFAFDYDSSGKMDHLVLYRPGTGTFWILKNNAGAFAPVYQGNGVGIGGYDLKSPADLAFALDYDGSGKMDHLALYRPGTGTFWILKNNAGAFTPVYQGNGVGIGGYNLKSPADLAFTLDYDGSGKMDHLALYRPGTGTFWILKNNAGAFAPVYQGNGVGIGGYDLKSPSDLAFALDYDGSGKMDHLALYRPGTGTFWILKNNGGAFAPVYQGNGVGIGGYDLKSAADRAFPFDYDGSGKVDHLALFRPGKSTISILENSAGMFVPLYAAW